MPVVWIDDVGAKGVIKDIPPQQIPLNAWSNGENIRFNQGYAERITGEEAVYNISISAVTVTQALAITPWWVLPVQYDTSFYLLYAGTNKVYAATNVSNHNNITRQSATSTASIISTSSDKDFSATLAIRWSGDVLGGLALLNNGINPPQYWTPTSATVRLVELDWDKSAGTKWSTRTAGAVTARVMRTYREYAIAMYTTEGSTVYPRRLRWSHPALPGATPYTWDDGDVVRDAGYKDFDESDDTIVDCKPLGDVLVVYKQRTTWAMQYVGGTYVHKFYRLFDNIGLLTPGCVESFMGMHILATNSDIVTHDGTTAKSVLKDKNRKWLFDNINQTYYYGCFTLLDVANNEFWFCYPSKAATSSFCDSAAIWNYRDDIWTFRTLDNVSFGVTGGVQAPSTTTDLAWSSMVGSWEEDYENWFEPTFSDFERALILSETSPANLVKAGSGFTKSNGDPYTSLLEKQFITLAGQGNNGPVSDPTRMKQVRGIRLRATGATGAVINVYIRSRMYEDDTQNWRGPYTWTVGTSRKIDLFITGRIFDLRFTTTSAAPVTLLSYGLDLSVAGVN